MMESAYAYSNQFSYFFYFHTQTQASTRAALRSALKTDESAGCSTLLNRKKPELHARLFFFNFSNEILIWSSGFFLFNNVLHPADSSVFKADLNAARVEAWVRQNIFHDSSCQLSWTLIGFQDDIDFKSFSDAASLLAVHMTHPFFSLFTSYLIISCFRLFMKDRQIHLSGKCPGRAARN